MSDCLVLDQHRIAVSEQLGDILRVFQWSDQVNLSMVWCVVTRLRNHPQRTEDD
jgi:hypothetical protein